MQSWNMESLDEKIFWPTLKRECPLLYIRLQPMRGKATLFEMCRTVCDSEGFPRPLGNHTITSTLNGIEEQLQEKYGAQVLVPPRQ
jgi:hypothetical protein